MRIIFMGTPEFAVASLALLIENNFEVVAVVTAPDKPSGRGQKIHESDVKKFAAKQGLPILQPNKLKSPDFLEELKSFRADLQVVVAFRMLPEVVWNMPPKGTINLHASLLPQYRGAAPINRAIMNGETQTGVTTFKLKHEIDSGQIIDQQAIPIDANDSAGDLHDKLMLTGAKLLLTSVNKIESGHLQLTPQSNLTKETSLKSAPKIFKEDCRVDWTLPVSAIYNHIRGLSPYPGAWTTLNGKQLKIFQVGKEETAPEKSGSKIITDRKSFLKIACKDGFISLKMIQPAGKKRMKIEDFLRGYRKDIHIK